jgi:hypothetical protein
VGHDLVVERVELGLQLGPEQTPVARGDHDVDADVDADARLVVLGLGHFPLTPLDDLEPPPPEAVFSGQDTLGDVVDVLDIRVTGQRELNARLACVEVGESEPPRGERRALR